MVRAEYKKPLAMKGKFDVRKLFSDPSVQIKLPGHGALCRYGRISLQPFETKRAPGGTKSSDSGTPVDSKWK
jgi:hypothetical protein